MNLKKVGFKAKKPRLNKKSPFFKGLLRQKTEADDVTTVVVCDPAGIRTQDHYIKSVMLYQLSYGIV